MAYDLEEQEQIDAFKAWWKQYGNTVLAGITVFVAGVGGTQLWQQHRHKETSQAAAMYVTMEKSLASGDAKAARDESGRLMEQHPNSAYAARAALLAATASYAAGDAKGAKGQLEWAQAHARSDEVKDVAQLRLAGVLLDEKNYPEALKALEAKHDAAYDGLYADLKGDVLVASGKPAEARAAYKLALEKLDPAGGYRRLVQLKLDALGG